MDGKSFLGVLSRDLPLKAAGLIYLCLAAFYLLAPPVNLERFGGPFLLLLTIAAMQYRLRKNENAEGRRFWNYVSAALGLWLAGGMSEALAPALRESSLGALFLDCVYASYYLTLVFATEIRPDLKPGTDQGGREEELHRGSTVSFILALLIYCSLIPSQRNPEEYLTGRFSILLYLCLDIFFLTRFAYLSGVARSARFRLTYRFFFIAYAISVMLLISQFADILAVTSVPLEARGRWGPLWYLVNIPLLLAARVSRYPIPEKRKSREKDELDAPRVWEPMVFYAIVFPLLHLLLDFYGQLSAPSRTVQQGLVIVYFAFFGFLALVHSTWREKKRRLAESALRESEYRYRQLIESHPDAILIEQEGRLVFVNATGAHKLGIASSGGGRSFASVGFPEPPGSEERSASFLPIECRVTGADEEEMDLEVAYFEISYVGKPALQAIARDVTEAKRLRAESERMTRLASLGQFSAAMAHEIRNPLAAIVMHSFFLSERLPKEGDHQESLADINAAVERMQKLVNGILTFVRPQALQFVEEDLVAVVHSARLGLERATDPSRIDVVENYRHHDATVEVDVLQMTTVFLHLLENAVDAMPDGGTLRLSTSNPSQKELQIIIEDDGSGIPEEDLERIFEPFFTRRDDGVGLGLALARRILDQHECRYRVESTLGEGTRFILRFALAGIAPVSGVAKRDEERVALNESEG